MNLETHVILPDLEAIFLLDNPGEHTIYDAFYDGCHLFVPRTFDFLAHKRYCEVQKTMQQLRLQKMHHYVPDNLTDNLPDELPCDYSDDASSNFDDYVIL